jgi:site-specific recombinase XerD
MSIPHNPKNSTMRKHTVDLGSNGDSFGIADEVTQLIDSYLLYRRATVSANTAATDERLLRYLREYLTTPDAQRHTQLRPLFLGFLGWLRDLRNTRSAATLNAICERVRAMLNWAHEEGLIDQVPLKRKETIRRPEPTPDPLSEDQIRKLLRPLERRTDWLSLRRLAILTVCLECGPRRGELLQMRYGDLKQGQSRVRQKGDRPHVIMLTRRALDACKRYAQAYQQQRGHRLQPSDMLWRSAAGLPLQADDLQRDLRRWGRKVGVYPLSVHRLRKTCATLRLAHGAPTEVVRRLLGHSTDRVLRHYVALTDKQQAELLEQTSPLSHTAKRKRR